MHRPILKRISDLDQSEYVLQHRCTFLKQQSDLKKKKKRKKDSLPVSNKSDIFSFPALLQIKKK